MPPAYKIDSLANHCSVIVSAPSIPLIIQWSAEVKRFGLNAVAPSLEPSTDTALTSLFRGVAAGGTHVAIVTNNLLCSPTFQSTVALKTGPAGDSVPTLFIADEAHTLGAEGFLSNKPNFFERRLALSATPERQYDPDGTEEIFAFFGPPVYEFGFDRAIGFCLSPYNYYVHAATLDGDELDAFDALTARIGAAIGRGLDDDDDSLTQPVDREAENHRDCPSQAVAPPGSARTPQTTLTGTDVDLRLHQES